MKEYANNLYEDIKTICSTATVKKSGKQLKWDIYRSIKQKVTYYKELAETERKRSGAFSYFDRPSKDEIKIHLLGSVVVKNQFTDAMSVEEYIAYILEVTSCIMKEQ